MKSASMILAALIFASSLVARAATPEISLPVPKLETLPNGLTLAWFLNDALPVTDVLCLIKSGERDDPVGKSGTAELVASLLDRGSKGMDAQAIARSVEMLGASRYASADADSFSIGVHGLSTDAQILLDLLAKMVIEPEFPAAEVKREHARLLDRWNHIGDFGETLAAIAFQRMISAGTPYGRGGFVSGREFKQVTREDVVRFHREKFTPKNAMLVVVGRVDEAEFRKRILASFGQWKGEAPVRAKQAFTESRIKPGPKQLLVVERAGLTQAQVRLGFRGPLIHSPDRYALAVGNALLGEYFNSRLNSVIRDKLSLTYSIGSSVGYSKDLGTITIASASRNETVGQLIRKTVEILRALKAGDVSEEEVATAKEYLKGGFPLGVATLSGVATRWLSGYFFDMGPEFLNEFIPKVSAVTRQDVVQAMRKHLDLEKLVVVVAGDGKAIEASLKQAGVSQALGLKSVRKLKLQDLE